ncbi:MAG: hypothetical protein WD068_01730 [Candidatus Babeliales bacterium]
MKKLLVLIILVTSCSHAIEIIQHYTLAQTEAGKKVIILTTNYGQNWLAKMHQDAIRYFLDYASIQGAELLIEGMSSIAKQSKNNSDTGLPLTESLILLAKKTRQINKLYISTPDCRTEYDAKVLLSFFPIFQLLEMGAPSLTAEMYNDLQQFYASNDSAMSIKEYLEHLENLRAVIVSKKERLGAALISDFLKNFDTTMSSLDDFLHTKIDDFSMSMSSFAIHLYKNKVSLKDISIVISLLTAPSLFAAQASFLSAIKESEETMDPTIVIITYPIAKQVIQHLEDIGFKSLLSVELVGTWGALDLWRLINLLYQSLGTKAQLEEQQSFLEQLKKIAA